MMIMNVIALLSDNKVFIRKTDSLLDYIPYRDVKNTGSNTLLKTNVLNLSMEEICLPPEAIPRSVLSRHVKHVAIIDAFLSKHVHFHWQNDNKNN